MRKTSSAFWDTSAVVPLCAHEATSAWARRNLREYGRIAVWWATPVEAQSAFARLSREGALTAAQKARAVTQLHRLQTAWIEILPTEEIRASATDLIQRYVLRSADAFQLAAALVWCDNRARNRTFITMDDKLALAAEEAGFSLLHP